MGSIPTPATKEYQYKVTTVSLNFEHLNRKELTTNYEYTTEEQIKRPMVDKLEALNNKANEENEYDKT